MRYSGIEAKLLEDGRTVLKTQILRDIPKSNSDIYIITQETDRLDTLAQDFYGDSTLWWVIAHANKINSADIGVDPGIQLRIPFNLSTITNL